MDQGHIETEKLLVALERKIKKIYGDASKEMKKEADRYFATFIDRDKKQQELLKAGKITEQEYKNWRLAQLGRGERFIALRDDLAKRITEANKVAASYINDDTPGIYSLNHNYAAYEIEQVAGNVGFTIYDEQTVKILIADDPTLLPKRRIDAPKDLKWNKKKFTAEITAGILLGESIGEIANRVQNLSDANRSGAIRNARTAVTGAQNAGRQASYNRAKEMDLPLRKRWIATKDNRTRHAHAMLDGQTVALDEPFKIEGSELMFPGDPAGRGYLVWNCRCTMRTVEKEGIEAEPRQIRVRNPETGRNELVSEMTYAEWAGWKTATQPTDSGSKKVQVQKAMAEKQEYTQAEQDEFAALQKKYKNKTEVMLFGTEEEMVRYDYLLQKDKANAGTFDYYKKFQHQSIAESRLNGWRVDPTTAERDAISSYSRSGYLKMNENLRFGNYAPDSVKREISALHGFLDKCETKEELYLSRGVTKPALDKMFGGDGWRKNSSSLVGSVFTDKGFVSTTPYQGGGFGGDVVMYIKAPKGTKGAYIKDFAASSEEKEFLIQSDTSFVVRNIVEEVDKWGDKKYKVFAEVII